MEILHSYWRMEYIKNPKTKEGKGNPFAQLSQTDNDKDALIVWIRSPLEWRHKLHARNRRDEDTTASARRNLGTIESALLNRTDCGSDSSSLL